MGSFNVSCCLSNSSISYGDKIGQILMVPAYDQPYGYIGNDAYICTNYGASSVYRAIALPIFGEYNDYGQLENIVRDNNVLCLEKYFGIPIEEISNSISSYYDGDVHKKLENVSSTFVLKNIYKSFALLSLKNGGSVYNSCTLSTDLLEKIGFEFVKHIDKDKLFKHKSSNRIYIASDGEFSRLVEKSNESFIDLDYSCYNLEQLQKSWWELLKRKLNFDEYKKISCFYYEHEEHIKAAEIMKGIGFGIRTRPNSVLHEQKMFWDIYENSILKNKKWVNKMVCDYLGVVSTLGSINKILMPTYIGPQCGNYDLELEVNKIINKHIKKKINSRD